MIPLMKYLQSNKQKSFILIIIYFALVILPHEWVGVNINKAFSVMSRDQYNQIILILFCSILIGLFIVLYKRLMAHPNKLKLLCFFAFTIACIIIVSKYLFVINIECVHYIQYAIGAILLFALLEHYFVALFTAFIIGLFDEAYQYFYLSPHRTDYYDINDIITNLLGAAFGLLILKTVGIPQCKNNKKMMKRGFLLPFIGISSSLIFLLKTNVLSVFPSADTFMLVRKLQTGFLTTVPPEVTFHIVQLLEGLVIIVLLFLVYYYRFNWKSKIL